MIIHSITSLLSLLMINNIFSVADSLNDEMQSCLVDTQGSTHRKHSVPWSCAFRNDLSLLTTEDNKEMPDNIPKFKKICADNQKSKLKLLKILYGSQFEYADLVDFLFAIQKNI